MEKNTYCRRLLRQKSATRGKLMGAISMLLVASVMLSSTTFAWYALSTAPEVRGVKTTLAANGNLEIALNHDALDAEYFYADTSDGGVDTIVERNAYWGNLLELDQADYGLQTVSLKPVILNCAEPDRLDQTDPFSFVQYGFDGRGVSLRSEGRLMQFDPWNSQFDHDGTYGVRAYCEEYQVPDPTIPPAYDPCAFGIDLLFRTNAEWANLLLQTSGVDRVYNDGNAPENWYNAYEFEQRQGSGSFITVEYPDGYLADPEARNILSALRVAFADTRTGQIYGIAEPDADGYLYLRDGYDQLVPLEKNEVMGITAWVYLSGLDIDNSCVDAVNAIDITINLQFSTDAILYPAMEHQTLANALLYNPSRFGGIAVSGNVDYERHKNVYAQLAIPETYENMPVSEIEDYAFLENGDIPLYSSVTSLKIPQSVVSIGESAFDGCENLTAFVVDSRNPNYSNDENGVLYNKDKTTLIRCPRSMAGTFTIPDTVTAIENGAFFRCDKLTEVIIPQSVATVGDRAFMGCMALENVSIAEGLTTVGVQAFGWCMGLTDITLPDSVTTIGDGAFDGCTALTEIELPDSATTIGNGAFYGCTALTEITLPDSVTTIGDSAFEGCTALTDITLSDRLTTVGANVFEGCTALTEITLPDSVTTIGGRAFYGCTALTDITLSDRLTTVGSSAFEGCTALTEIELPDSVTTIGNGAFYGCTALTEITLPDSVTTIGSRAFYGCTALTDITLSDRLTTVGSSAFEGCTALTEITLPDSVTTVGSSAFRGCTGLTKATLSDQLGAISDSMFQGCTKLTEVTIPGSVVSIGKSAFSGCTALTGVNLVNGVTTIGEYAFSGCTALTGIVLPNSVTSVGSCTFLGCTGLTYVTLSDQLNSVSGSMFARCCKLTEVNIPDSVTSIGIHSFSDCSALTRVSIGKGTKVMRDVFFNCTSLREFVVDSENSWYCNDDAGVLYSKDKTQLVRCPAVLEGSYVIPNSVTVIKSEAFSGCKKLTDVTIPYGVPEIADHVFYGCSGLTSVTIPDSVRNIGMHAFDRCTSLTSVVIPDKVWYIGSCAFNNTALTSVNIPASMTQIDGGVFSYSNSLTTVTYDGTKAQWKALVGSRDIGLTAADYTIYCTDGTIAKDGTETGT